MHEIPNENKSINIEIIDLKVDDPVKHKEQNEKTKIICLINQMIKENQRFYSFEVSPNRELKLDYNEFPKSPLFTAITWLGEVNVDYEGEKPPSIEMIDTLIKSTPVLSHLTCYKMTIEKLEKYLNFGITNVLALTGDTSNYNSLTEHGNRSQFCTDAQYLIKAIRSYDESICIVIGGYPQKHPKSESLESDLEHMKRKIDIGGSVIITQTNFSATEIIQFIKASRAIGVKVPILPGIFIPYSFRSAVLMCKVSKTTMPQDLFNRLKELQNDEEALQQFSVDYMTSMIKELFECKSDPVYGVHFFTLNQFKLIKEVLRKLNI